MYRFSKFLPQFWFFVLPAGSDPQNSSSNGSSRSRWCCPQLCRHGQNSRPGASLFLSQDSYNTCIWFYITLLILLFSKLLFLKDPKGLKMRKHAFHLYKWVILHSCMLFILCTEVEVVKLSVILWVVLGRRHYQHLGCFCPVPLLMVRCLSRFRVKASCSLLEVTSWF